MMKGTYAGSYLTPVLSGFAIFQAQHALKLVKPNIKAGLAHS